MTTGTASILFDDVFDVRAIPRRAEVRERVKRTSLMTVSPFSCHCSGSNSRDNLTFSLVLPLTKYLWVLRMEQYLRKNGHSFYQIFRQKEPMPKVSHTVFHRETITVNCYRKPKITFPFVSQIGYAPINFIHRR